MIVLPSVAKESGLTWYFTGKPCKHGHIAKRQLVNGTCFECVSVYHKERRKSDPEFVAAVSARVRAYKAKDPSEYNRKRRARRTMSESDRRWIEENREKIRATKARWKKRNPSYGAAWAMKREAQKRFAYPTWADDKAILAIYERCAQMTAETGVQHHVDHIVPLLGKNVCGLHVHYNLQVLTAVENVAKSNRWSI